MPIPGKKHAASAAALLAALLLIVPTAGATPRRTPIAVGVNVAGAPGDPAGLQSYMKLVGRTPAMVMWYQQWSEPLFYSVQMTNLASTGSVPIITWDPLHDGVGIPLSRIAAGRYDGYIRASAKAARSYRGLMLVRFAHEMNLAGSGFAPGDRRGDTPKTFIAAWRHVVRIFRAEHATNVEWVWSPNVDCGGKCPFTKLYPGNAWVDWVALDGYNYSSVDHTPWLSFNQIFRSSYRTITRLTGKPVMVGETASAPRGGNKASWIAHSFSQLPAAYPRIRAVVWFDRNKETDWMVNSSARSLQAWDGVVHSPAYAGSPQTLSRVVPMSHDVDSGWRATRRTEATSRRGETPQAKPPTN